MMCYQSLDVDKTYYAKYTAEAIHARKSEGVQSCQM